MNTVIITRHNYEEFFLLYVDDELESSQRMIVEKFLEENPDLAGELQILQQATLPDDVVQFTGKEILYKQENGISLSNYEEYFLLSVDDELTQQQKNEVEKFVLQHPQLQSEFTLLQETKLKPELISLRDKKELYRQDKTRRIIPLALIRISVAAAILGLAVTVWVFRSTSPLPGVATHKVVPLKVPSQKVERRAEQVAVTEQRDASASKKAASVKDAKSAVTVSKRSLAGKSEKVEKIKTAENVAVNKTTPEERGEIITTDKRSANEAMPGIKEQKYKEQPTLAFKNNTGINADSPNETQTKTTLVSHPALKDEPPLASNTLYREIEADEEEKTVYIGGAQINKSKLKGFFKKAAGFLDKKIGRNINEKLLQ